MRTFLKNSSILLLLLFVQLQLFAQSAEDVLNKTANRLRQSCYSLTFQSNMGNGTITVQQNQFVLHSSQANIWFDGHTQWVNLTNSNEVNLSNPSAAEIARTNPINILYLYKQGYNSTLSKKQGLFEIKLTSKDAKKNITEAVIYIDSDSYMPKNVKYRTKKGGAWNTVYLPSVKKESNKSAAFFRFNPKQYPKLEIVDLR